MTATAPSGASLVALNFTGLTNEEGEVLVLDRAADGTASEPVRLNRNERSSGVAAAMASSGAALVAWRESSDSDEADDVTTLQVAAREAGGAFVRLGALDSEAARRRSGHRRCGLRDRGLVEGRAEPRQRVAAARRDARSGRRLLGAARARHRGGPRLDEPRRRPRRARRCSRCPTTSGVRIATGTTRTGFAGLRRLATDTTEGVTTALSANGAAAVGWLTPADENAPRGGVDVSDRLPGGDFGAPHPLAASGTRLGGNDARKLRLAAAPDGRVVASWAVLVKAGDHLEAPVPVAALRRADGGWDAAVALAAPCREQLDAFGGFDAAGRPRVTFVDTALISGGDYGFPYDTRIRVARLDARARDARRAAEGDDQRQPPAGAAQGQAQAQDPLRAGVRRDGLRRHRALRRPELRLVPGLRTAVARPLARRHGGVRRATSTAPGRCSAEGARVKVRLVVHACDSFGRLARARRTIGVRVPRTYG